MSRIGYIGFAPQQPVDALLSACVAELRAQGVRVTGVMQVLPAENAAYEGALNFRDVEDGAIIRFSQDLGEGATGCSLDPQALAEVAQKIGGALERKPQLVVINRFGKAEADGHGLRSVVEQALLADIPLLVAVRDDFRPSWDAFHGGMAERLPCDKDAVLEWCEAAIG